MILEEFCTFLENIYGGTHTILHSKLKFDFLIIENESDKFKINLSDKTRFGYFTLFHRDSSRTLEGLDKYHFQGKSRNLSYLIFMAYQHHMTRKYHILFNTNDYNRLMRDWQKAILFEKI